MKQSIKNVALVVTTVGVLALAGTGGVYAADLITGEDVRNNTITTKDVKNGTLKGKDLSVGLNSKISEGVGPRGPAGADGINGTDGKDGRDGANGRDGTNGMLGAYYSVAFYNVGNTNAGAVATVACSSVTDVALSGGVQVLGLDAGSLGRNTPVSSSFPGRMDFTTNTPRPGRLDGWIVQFGGNAGTVSDKSPEKVKVWALCLPNGNVPVVQTYVQDPTIPN